MPFVVSRVSERRWPQFEACTARHRGRKCNLDECGPAVGIAGVGARALIALGPRRKKTSPGQSQRRQPGHVFCDFIHLIIYEKSHI